MAHLALWEDEWHATPAPPPPVGNCEPLLGEHRKRTRRHFSEALGPSSLGIGDRPGAGAEMGGCNRGDSPRGPAAPGFEVGDRALIHSEFGRELRLGEPEPPPRGEHPVADGEVRFLGGVPEESDEAPVVTG